MVLAIITAIASATTAFGVWRLLKKYYAKLRVMYSVINILCSAIESIEEMTGIIPDKAVEIAKKVKAMVNRFLGKKDKILLDGILKEKQLFKGGGDK